MAKDTILWLNSVTENIILQYVCGTTHLYVTQTKHLNTLNCMEPHAGKKWRLCLEHLPFLLVIASLP